MTVEDGDLADWLTDEGEEDDLTEPDTVDDSSTSPRRVAPEGADVDPDTLADDLAVGAARGNALADALADAGADRREGWRALAAAHSAGVLARARTLARAGWRTCVRLWAYLLAVAWALDPRTRFPAPPDADVPEWAFASAPYVRGLASWARAELRPGPLFGRWMGWVEDRQNRLLAAAGFAGTLVGYILAAVGRWPIDGLLGALALWFLTVLYVPAGVALALKQSRGEFDRGWFDLPDQPPEEGETDP